MEKLISVIVPIYNVAQYLPKSLDSIINQTYKNLQIILVNDFSNDNSSSICDEYAAKDNRISVIHRKSRGGVSDARNDGLRAVSGDYIGFIDPDDYIEPCFFQKLYEAIVRDHADIAVCNYHIFGQGLNQTGKTPTVVLNSQQAMELLIADNEVTSYLWNKLFLADLFMESCFDSGYRYEDIRIIHKIFLKSARITAINSVLYHYRIRKGSITNSTVLNKSKELIEALECRCSDLKNTEYYIPACYAEMIQIRRIISDILISHVNKDDFFEEEFDKLKSLYHICQRHIKMIQKIKFMFFMSFPMIYAKVFYRGRR